MNRKRVSKYIEQNIIIILIITPTITSSWTGNIAQCKNEIRVFSKHFSLAVFFYYYYFHLKIRRFYAIVWSNKNVLESCVCWTMSWCISHTICTRIGNDKRRIGQIVFPCPATRFSGLAVWTDVTKVRRSMKITNSAEVSWSARGSADVSQHQ